MKEKEENALEYLNIDLDRHNVNKAHYHKLAKAIRKARWNVKTTRIDIGELVEFVCVYDPEALYEESRAHAEIADDIQTETGFVVRQKKSKYRLLQAKEEPLEVILLRGNGEEKKEQIFAFVHLECYEE